MTYPIFFIALVYWLAIIVGWKLFNELIEWCSRAKVEEVEMELLWTVTWIIDKGYGVDFIADIENKEIE